MPFIFHPLSSFRVNKKYQRSTSTKAEEQKQRNPKGNDRHYNKIKNLKSLNTMIDLIHEIQKQGKGPGRKTF